MKNRVQTLLHLVFGFLEWRESDDSTQIRQAPLLVVPVFLITPKAKEEDRSIRLQYTGEDLTTNLSLVEKMRRDFGLEMPYIEEGETPEQYFRRFAPNPGAESVTGEFADRFPLRS